MRDTAASCGRLLRLRSKSGYEDDYHVIWHQEGFTDSYFVHSHDYYEITFYLGQEPTVYLLNGTEYEIRQGDIVFAGLFQPHMMKFRRNERHERFTLGAESRMLLSFSTANDNLLRIFEKGDHYPILHPSIWKFSKYMELLEKLTDLEGRPGRELWERALIYEILAMLYEDGCGGEASRPANLKRAEMLAKLIRYIETHLEKTITLDELAGLVNYSVPHICRIFKEETSDTLNHYILQKRLQKAKYLLMSGKSVSQVAELTGFNSCSYFYRAFKKLNHMGPDRWRQLNGG